MIFFYPSDLTISTTGLFFLKKKKNRIIFLELKKKITIR
jgi:hypothetical protein